MSDDQGPRADRQRPLSKDELPQPEFTTRTEGETFDVPEGARPFTKGRVLGERYEILELLGRGGMGEVWRALDLKLRVEVALKALRGDLFKSELRLEMLRQEVRVAREVMSPNVCRIFDLIEMDGREFVSMEYVDGATLLAVLHERGPLELKEAQDIASQLLAGLEAIHKVGLVHRDIKPENIMLTRAGRVVVMDFGLAREPESGAGTVSGTPAYMAPEQAAGQTLDARADVYSAGVVLAEMVCPEGIKNIDSRQSVWEGVRSEPAQVADTPWSEVIKKAVAKDRESRFDTAHTLTRALEDVTLRVEGAEDLHPYPGLASFTKDDAEYFFGREAEIEQMWRKLEGPPRMLALVGPSGAGKSSFIMAGLIPGATVGWTVTVCTPGTNPELALSRALGSELAGDAEAVDLLLRFDDPEIAAEVVSRWRRRATRALLIVDQFEELFTQNASDNQRRFAERLRLCVLECDVHVLLSMRDDFLFRCHEIESLKPIFSELTPIGPPIGGALRRALVRPATTCGYRFEDDDLVDEMLDEVEGERGALPLMAFSAARLWENRDRESGLLTREAYHDIGGVGGALAQHAEATIDGIGTERIPIVRELFRNLVTAEGTRAVREWNELLSVFEEPQRESAEEVMRELIDARLLTSYEVKEDDREPTRQVEIIHESLLANWPRLVRWQTQDADAVQLRDQLRQAAKTWDDQGRSDDTLWTGAAYREFASWRERYPGGLTEIEGAFADAMTSLAGRRRRRRRFAAGAALALATIVILVVSLLWRRSVREAQRAEASKLVALGELKIESNPTAALAWATASLKLIDNLEARMLALRALQQGPPMTVLPLGSAGGYGAARLAFNPSGRWLVTSAERATLWSHDGRDGIRLDDHDEAGEWLGVAFSEEEVFITEQHGVCRWWSTTNPLQPLRLEAECGFLPTVRGDSFFTYSTVEDKERIHRWSLNGEPPTVVGGMEPWGRLWDDIDADGSRLAYARGKDVFVRSLIDWSSPPTVIGTHESRGHIVEFLPDGKHVAAADDTGDIRIWSADRDTRALIRTISDNPSNSLNVKFDRSGRWLAAGGLTDDGLPIAAIWDLEAPEGCLAQQLRRDDPGDANYGSLAFHPSGRWLAAANYTSVGFWPLSRPYPRVLDHRGRVFNVAFSPDGDWLVSAATGEVIAWPLKGQNRGKPQILLEQPGLALYMCRLAVHPSGAHVAVSNQAGEVIVLPIEGGEPIYLANPEGTKGFRDLLAFSSDGRYLAAAPSPPTGHDVGEMDVRVWDLETGEGRAVGKVRGQSTFLGFIDEHRLLWSGAAFQDKGGGEYLFDLEKGTFETVPEDGPEAYRAVSSTARFAISLRLEEFASGSWKTKVLWRDLESGESRVFSTHGNSTLQVGLDLTDLLMATGSWTEGLVRVGPVNGEEPHLLIGHSSPVTDVEFSPDGRWIASSSWDKTVRLWPVPDMAKTPLHVLPHGELIAKLKTLTNLRAVRNEESSTGWTVEVGPFPGWKTVPEW